MSAQNNNWTSEQMQQETAKVVKDLAQSIVDSDENPIEQIVIVTTRKNGEIMSRFIANLPIHALMTTQVNAMLNDRMRKEMRL